MSLTNYLLYELIESVKAATESTSKSLTKLYVISTFSEKSRNDASTLCSQKVCEICIITV